MTRMTRLHVAISGTLLGVVTHLFVQSTSIDPEAHVRALEIIDSLSQSETDLRRNLLLVRGDLLLRYDTVNGALDELRERLDELRGIAAVNDRLESGAMSDRFALLEMTVAREEGCVGQLKWQEARLGNSGCLCASKTGTAQRGGARKEAKAGR